MVELVTSYLEELGIRTTGCHDGHEALVAARGEDVDAMVLDLMLPGVSGLDVCRRLRREGNEVPILMLTARGAVPSGSPAWRRAPTTTSSSRSRSRSWSPGCGRSAGAASSPRHRLTAGDVVLDPLEQRVRVADVEVPLSRREFAMLQVLMENPGRVVSPRSGCSTRSGTARSTSAATPSTCTCPGCGPVSRPPRRCRVTDPAGRRLPAGDDADVRRHEPVAAAGRRPAHRDPARARGRGRDDRGARAGRRRSSTGGCPSR